MIVLDIDHFKRVNDTYGHPTGDAVLVAMAQAMNAALRTDDVVGRYGGEEFMIVLRSNNANEFWSVVERMRLMIAREPIRAHGNVVSITVSQGMAVPAPEEDLGDLIKRADKALYDAKHGGRNQAEQPDSSGMDS